MHRFGFLLLLWLFLSAICWKAEACRFNVRDVGFVDFGRENYTLSILYKHDSPSDLVESLKQISFAALLDSNIETQEINLDENPNHSIINQIEKHNIQNYPALVLESPREKSTVLPLDDPSSKNEIWNVMEDLVSSPLREKVLDHTLRTYGVLLFVEGGNQEQTQSALHNVKTAMQNIENGMDRLPKEIKEPPVLMVVSADEREQEKTSLWSLGIPSDSASPYAAVLYGRGRLIGDVLSGKQITKDRTQYILSVVGLSCECGLDRTWLLGQMFPLRWDSARQKTATKLLSFDPENPMIKTEMSQIMAQGNNAQSAGSGTNRSQTQMAMSDPLMGYSEMSVIDSQNPPAETQPEASNSSSQTNTTNANQEILSSNLEPNHSQENNSSQLKESSTKASTSSFPLLLLFGVGALIIGGGIIIGIRGTPS